MELEFKGVKELEAELMKLADKVAIKYLRDSGKAAMKPVLADMKSNANKDKGVLEKTLKLKTTRRRGKGLKKNRAMAIQAGMYTNKRSKERERVNAAMAQEFGNSRQDAEPFIRPALNKNAQRVLDTFKRELGRRLEQ